MVFVGVSFFYGGSTSGEYIGRDIVLPASQPTPRLHNQMEQLEQEDRLLPMNDKIVVVFERHCCT